ncbi:MAG: class I SAM-dependent methyltransferase [Methanoregula sp.]|nr:class I SAM-dependent methyltransferase [Methanoregula sp.]
MSEYFEQAAIVWDKDPNRVQMAKTIADAMIHALHFQGTEIIMDYGTGTGLVALQCRQHVRHIVAVDSSPKMLAVLNEKLAVEGITNIEPREWSVGEDTSVLPRFDCIVSSMTLHHVRDTIFAARTFHSLLVPGGRIAIADLDAENGEFHEKPGIAEHDGFDRKQLERIFSRAGFVDIRFAEAATIAKPSSRTGKIRNFPIFLLTATRA